MKKPITILVFSIFSLILIFNIPQAYSYEIIYPTLDYKHTKIPNYCIVRPNDQDLNEGQKDWMVEMAKDAVAEWDSTLQGAFTHSYAWQLMSTTIGKVEQASGFQCDWTIEFQPEIPSFFTFGAVLGYADINNEKIVIRYSKVNQEEFHDVLLHEIGHSLGLGHFTTDDSQIMSNWLRSESPPSIMIPNIHQNPGLTYLTEVDIDKLKEIYGEGGFLHVNVKESEEKETQLSAIGAIESLTVSPEKIVVKKYQTNMVNISGKLKKDFVLSGVPLHLVIIQPDSNVEVMSIYPTSSGTFQFPLPIDDKAPFGKYLIEAVYRDRTVSYQSASYWVESEYAIKPIQATPEEKKTVPLWVKNNAKWWAEGIVDDESFVNGLQYLVEQKIIIIPILEAKTGTSSNEIPEWIKNTAGWWANGDISEDEFLKALEFLVKQGIIRV